MVCLLFFLVCVFEGLTEDDRGSLSMSEFVF